MEWWQKIAKRHGLGDVTCNEFRRLGAVMALPGCRPARHDAHVRVYLDRCRLLTCQKCGSKVLRKDWPEEPSGAKRPHCGCRTGKHKTSKWGLEGISGASYSRAARIMALPGFKPVKHDAHVVARDARLRLMKRAEAEARKASERDRRRALTPALKRRRTQALQNACTQALSDGYIARRLKKNMPALKGVRIPAALIEAERQRLKIVRLIKQKESK